MNTSLVHKLRSHTLIAFYLQQPCGKLKADISLTLQITIIPILLMRKLRLGKVNNNLLKVIS